MGNNGRLSVSISNTDSVIFVCVCVFGGSTKCGGYVKEDIIVYLGVSEKIRL